MLFSQSNSLTSMPEAKMILDSMFFTNSFASVVKSDVEIGGVDQRFNLLAGRTLQEHASQVPQNIVMTTFPVEGTDGRKMSSSWGNTINFLDTPEDMFGKVMAVRDILVMKYFNLLTRVSGIEEYKKQFESDPKGVKKKLAGEIVKMYHSEKNAEKAEENWENTFSKKEIPDDVQEIKVDSGTKIMDVLQNTYALTKSGFRICVVCWL